MRYVLAIALAWPSAVAAVLAIVLENPSMPRVLIVAGRQDREGPGPCRRRWFAVSAILAAMLVLTTSGGRLVSAASGVGEYGSVGGAVPHWMGATGLASMRNQGVTPRKGGPAALVSALAVDYDAAGYLYDIEVNIAQMCIDASSASAIPTVGRRGDARPSVVSTRHLFDSVRSRVAPSGLGEDFANYGSEFLDDATRFPTSRLDSAAGTFDVPPHGRMTIDLEGRSHFETSLQTSVDTPHVKFETRHVGPNGNVSYTSGPVPPATQDDLRLVERVLNDWGR